jgi:hypothetical protein
MPTFRVAMFVVCLVTVSINAQDAPPAGVQSNAVQSNAVQSNAVHQIATQADYSGTNGAVLLESPATSMLLKAIGASMPMTFETNGTERMRIFSTGNISIGHMFLGSTTNDGKLSVYDNTNGTRTLSVVHNSTVTANVAQIDYGVYAAIKQDVAAGTTNSANIAAGYFEAYNTGTGTIGATIGGRFSTGNASGVTGTITNAYAILAHAGAYANGTITNGYGVFLTDVLATNDYAFYQVGANDTNYFAGDVGIGTNAPAQKLQVVGNAAFTNPDAAGIVTLYLNGVNGASGSSINAMGASYTAQPNTANSAGSLALMNYEAGGLSLTSSNTTTGNVRIYTGGSGSGNERMRVVANGNVGIGTQTPTAKLHVQGDIVASAGITSNGAIFASGNISAGGTIFAKYQDVAEWVPSTTDLAPGTVVVLNPDKDNEVMASAHPYDTAVAGVVSAQPGLILGVGSDTKEQIATSGRVLVRVDARNAPVHVGDLLVTSDMPGTAMRSQPIDLGGHKIHQPGTIIGKALQPLESGVGEILVLLSMQ